MVDVVIKSATTTDRKRGWSRQRRMIALTLGERIAAIVKAQGPISIAKFMAAANAHYYGSRDPFGKDGDFITAPEISQMFGELIGLWMADLWIRAGRPHVHYVELGPGRGTLAADALRAMASVGLKPQVHLVETSPVLKQAQQALLPDAIWHEHILTLPEDAPLMIIANEFFDALPIHQLYRYGENWHEREIDCIDEKLEAVVGKLLPDDIIPASLREAEQGSVIETCPEAVAVMRTLSTRIGAQGGAAIIIDYGHEGPQVANTLQAVRNHCYADPFANPGEQDMTAFVDFATLGAMAELCGLRVQGAVGQGQWLHELGLEARAESLIAAQPDRAETIRAAADRLASAEQMGTLFRVMAVTAMDWPVPEGFAAEHA
jgi:NADH dehydrogenase [ubiquinone] 1 alpha subcomplex assembly factor 7